MKGDIAVAGFRMTAEEWQALDAASRAELVAVITRREEAVQLAAGSGPIPLELEPDPESGAILLMSTLDSGAVVAFGAGDPDSSAIVPRVRAVGTDASAIVGRGVADLDDLLALMNRTEYAVAVDSGPLIMISRGEDAADDVAAVGDELDFGAL